MENIKVIERGLDNSSISYQTYRAEIIFAEADIEDIQEAFDVVEAKFKVKAVSLEILPLKWFVDGKETESEFNFVKVLEDNKIQLVGCVGGIGVESFEIDFQDIEEALKNKVELLNFTEGR